MWRSNTTGVGNWEISVANSSWKRKQKKLSKAFFSSKRKTAWKLTWNITLKRVDSFPPGFLWIISRTCIQNKFTRKIFWRTDKQHPHVDQNALTLIPTDIPSSIDHFFLCCLKRNFPFWSLSFLQLQTLEENGFWNRLSFRKRGFQPKSERIDWILWFWQIWRCQWMRSISNASSMYEKGPVLWGNFSLSQFLYRWMWFVTDGNDAHKRKYNYTPAPQSKCSRSNKSWIQYTWGVGVCEGSWESERRFGWRTSGPCWTQSAPVSATLSGVQVTTACHPRAVFVDTKSLEMTVYSWA